MTRLRASLAIAVLMFCAIAGFALWQEGPILANGSARTAPYERLQPIGEYPITIPSGASVMFIGDSNTHGSRRHEGPPFPNLIAEDDNRITVINAGRGGDTAQNGLQRFPSLNGLDLCFVNFGTNDAAPRRWLGSRSPIPLDAYSHNLSLLVRECEKTGARAIILAPLPGGSRAIARRLHPYRVAARQTAAQSGVDFLDPGSAFVAEGQTGPLTVDAIHLNQLGHEQLAAWFSEYVLSVSEAEPQP